MSDIITSRNNKHIIEAAKLHDKKNRDKTGVYFFEGNKLFKEAFKSKTEFCKIFVTQNSLNEHKTSLDSLRCPIYTVTDSVYEKLTLDAAPDGIFCIAKKQNDISLKKNGKKFILSSIRDPGNLGTAIRSARAFSIDELILHDCTEPTNPKVIRASMGACFRQQITVIDDLQRLITSLTFNGYDIYPTALTDKSCLLNDIKVNNKTVFIVGNEGHGLSNELITACPNQPVIIPMSGDTESLNVAVAASILMWTMSLQ